MRGCYAALILCLPCTSSGALVHTSRSVLVRSQTTAPAARALAPPRASLPAGAVDGFLGDGEARSEAEEAFCVTVSNDPDLWESSNDFARYEGSGWKLTSVERVMLLTTYVALNYLVKLEMDMQRNGFDEDRVVPVLGRQRNNVWRVHGYIDPRSRIVRSTEGVSYGQWFLQTLESDATDSCMRYEMRSSTGIGCVLAFERL